MDWDGKPPTTVFECESSRRLVQLMLQKGGKPEFEGRVLKGLDLSELTFDGTSLARACLRNASLSCCGLEKSEFSNADLCECNLSGMYFLLLLKSALFKTLCPHPHHV